MKKGRNNMDEEKRESAIIARDATDRAYWLAEALIRLGKQIAEASPLGKGENGYIIATIAEKIRDECGEAGNAICEFV